MFDAIVQLRDAGGNVIRQVRYDNVESWRIVNIFVNALFVAGGPWDDLHYHEFHMRKAEDVTHLP